LWILAAQLIAGASIINVLTGAPRWGGSVVGGDRGSPIWMVRES
jgi:hypothetical protein